MKVHSLTICTIRRRTKYRYGIGESTNRTTNSEGTARNSIKAVTKRWEIFFKWSKNIQKQVGNRSRKLRKINDWQKRSKREARENQKVKPERSRRKLKIELRTNSDTMNKERTKRYFKYKPFWACFVWGGINLLPMLIPCIVERLRAVTGYSESRIIKACCKYQFCKLFE